MVTTEIDPAAGGMKIMWVEPHDSGEAVMNYTIMIKHGDSDTYETEMISCNGFDATVVANKYCVVPMVGTLPDDPMNPPSITGSYGYVLE